MSQNVVDTEFPIWGLLPKKETGVINFLSKYPDFDGKGTVIAILDSGVDPGAPGLQETSDGKTKVIERFDCSGCGDVNTTTVVTPVDGVITGLTGRQIKIPSDWKNPSGTYRIGVKHAYDLYPDRLKDRMKQEYKKKSWEESHKRNLAEVTRELNEFERSHPGNGVAYNDVLRLEKENIDAKIDIINNFDKKYVDQGPAYDCVLFHDGDKWMCAVDTTDDGDISKCPVLGEYSITHDFAPLTTADHLNISINVHNNGNTLELVSLCSSHGTHVASIASAYFPDNPEQNGVAPGAQIVSLTIGDGRLGSMETGTAIMRAMIKIVELRKKNQVHVINMSYGEHVQWVDSGRIGELMNEIVNKYGVVWVASAGNNGPAICTISTPSDISQEPIISVGAYVSPEMMIAEYAMPQKLHGTPYTWSSRGPTIDGGIGVHVCAPGGAITSVPNFTLRYSQLMNGTSMASPHVAGAISILISGMLQSNFQYSPYLIKRSLENTAKFDPAVEFLAQGHGLVQIDKAFEFLTSHHNACDCHVRFNVLCGQSGAKGIYLRSKLHTACDAYKVAVEPFFLDSDNVEPHVKINFNMKFTLTCDDTFVTFPRFLDLANLARMFSIKIDTSGLAEGIHTTSIMAFDVNNINKGALFKIPITVIVPHDVVTPQSTVKYADNFKPNTIKRHYFNVPSSATWAVLRLISDEDSGRFVIHTVQSLPRQSCKAMETNKTLAVTSNIETTHCFQVKGGLVLEVVIAKYWANLGEANLKYSIAFHGVKPNQPAITMHAADGVHTVEVQTLQGEEIAPVVTLKNSVQILKPSEGKIAPLTARDIIPNARQVYELVLLYTFNISKPCEVSPNFAPLSCMLYESDFESQLWCLYDSNKQLIGVGDAYPSKYWMKVDKGEYTIRLQVRHDKKDHLEKLNESPLLLVQKLSNSIPMDVYVSYSQALIGGKKTAVTYNPSPSTLTPLYIAPLAADKFQLKSQNAAHYLTGFISYAKDDYGKRVDTYPIKYYLVDQSNNKKPNNSNNNSDKTKMEEYNEALRDMKTQWLSKIDKADCEKFYEDLVENYPDHLPIHSAYLQIIDPLDKRALPSTSKPSKETVNVETLTKVKAICDIVIKNVNQEALLAFCAIKTDTRSDASKIKSMMDQLKSILIECISRRGVAISRLYAIDEKVSENSLEEIANVWKMLLKFVDPSDAKVVSSHSLYFAIWHAYSHKQFGRMLKYLLKMQEDKPTKDIEEKIIEFSKAMNWQHIEKHLQRSLPTKFPVAFRPF